MSKRLPEIFLFDVFIAGLKVKEEVWNIIHNYLDKYLELIKRKIKDIPEKKKIELIKLFNEENKHIDFITKELKNL